MYRQPLLLEEKEEGGREGEEEGAQGGPRRLPPPLPETEAGLFSLCSFSWLNPILSTGYKRPLTHEDLYQLHPKETADVICGRLEENWEDEQLHRRKPSLARALRRSFGWTFFIAALYKFAYDSLLFVGPLLLKQLIIYLGSDDPVYVGFEYLGLLFVAAVCSSISLHQYFHRCFRTGMRLKSAVIGLVYKKALKIRPGQSKGKEAKEEGVEQGKAGTTVVSKPGPPKRSLEAKSTGEITNLMAVDAQRLQDLMSYFSTLWSAPYQCSLALFLLYRELGVAIVGGLGVMLISIPISAFVARRTREIQRKVMAVKDERIKVTNEVLSGIKIIKLYAWERSFQEKIRQVRDKELRLLRQYMMTNIVARFTWNIVPLAVSLTSFAVYVLMGHELTSSTAFTSIALFNILRFPLAMFPQMLSSTAEALLSLERIARFLETPEVDPLPSLGPARPVGPPVVLEDVTLSWGHGKETETLTFLRDLRFTVPAGTLTVIFGATGAGKSGLLLALIGDLTPSKGTLRVHGSIAYVAQTAWIQNETVRENILFGKAYDQGWYTRVVEACALLPDLAILPAGDQTEIGEKGINLSGGQKARIALARALYQQCEVYVLDDCLAAVDSEVAKHILDNCICGLLREKTVLLATHNLHTLERADQLLLLEGQRMAFKGTYTEFARTGHTFVELTRGVGGGSSSNLLNMKAVAEGESGKEDRVEGKEAKIEQAAQQQKKETDAEGGKEEAMKKKRLDSGKLVEKEAVGRGSVGTKIYRAYIRCAGGIGVFLLALAFLWAGQALQIGSNFWLSIWSDESLEAEHGLSIYAILCSLSAVVIVFTLLSFTLAGMRAARVFHEGILGCLMRAPMAFFDTTPLGRILNRFSKDTYTVDETLMPSIYMYLQCMTGVLGTIIVIATVNGWFLPAVVPPFMLYYFAQNYYVPSSRELKRLDSVSRSPIFSHFGASLEGTSTIRAFRAQFMFIKDNEKRVDYNLQAYYMYISSNRWLAMRLEFVGACIVSLAGIFSILGRDHGVTAGKGGLSISYALSITQTLNWMVRMTSEVETNIVAVERIQEYSEVPSEAPALIEGKRPPPGWPQAGKVAIKNLCLSYRPGLPLVLRNLSLDINPGERIGIVGRTGAGKSSLLLALLRLVEAESGSIEVDGLNTREMGTEDLRSRFSIIPQDPVLFTGSVRFNLDPFDQYSDNDIWRALERAHLAAQVRRLPQGLLSEVEEGGKNFSLGERQLLCMARALLRHSRVLLLDEATSAVDAETDRLIQETIRTQFRGATLLTIAHRIFTLVDYDRIAVLDAGTVVEFDTPLNLLKKKGGAFRGLAEKAAGDMGMVMDAFEAGAKSMTNTPEKHENGGHEMTVLGQNNS
ncbi:multidrug resistance-associated protein 1-like isoform 1 [Nannochloropsis gaditana]|uniref:Multidrug resistance-associated protein 1-like isoform 1 n=1 Tax=Nannochloropsis gaditana TaxID=72520 RepID=W7TP76_9STRA|nr:multidrug resistance-associated protein 1-like isoform 1 [Nannochloropsis gaditana]